MDGYLEGTKPLWLVIELIQDNNVLLKKLCKELIKYGKIVEARLVAKKYELFIDNMLQTQDALGGNDY